MSKLFIPRSPYLLLPKSLCIPDVLNGPDGLRLVLRALMFETVYSNDPYFDTAMGGVDQKFLMLTIEEFIRQGFNSKFRLGDEAFQRYMKPLRTKDCMEPIKLDAALWLATWEMLERMDSLTYLWEPKALIFGRLINEGALLRILMFNSSGDVTFTATLKKWQRQNSQLSQYECPFTREREPTTQQFITLAIGLAERFDRFRLDRYRCMVHKRSKLVQKCKTHGMHLCSQDPEGKIVMKRQGRKKQQPRS